VAVGVGQARHDDAARQVDRARPGGAAPGFGRIADEGDRALTHEDGQLGRLRIRRHVDKGALEEEVGRR